ncbi:hypothetical protein ACFL5K_04455 [Gemmatimonadota bacterium]
MPKGGPLSLKGEHLIIQGLDIITKFTRFHPVNTSVFLDGLELAENLTAEAGTILYTKDTEITHERVAKLLKLRESNTSLDFSFMIKRNEKLLNILREEIKGRVLKLLKRRQATKTYKDLMVVVADSIEPIIDKILEDENILLELYQLRFICESAEIQRSVFYADHSINVALFCLAIITSNKLEDAAGKDKERLAEIVKAALFHNYGALLEIDDILHSPSEERVKKYWEATLKGIDKLAPLKFSYDMMMGIRGLCDYHSGRRDFVGKLEGAELFANILVVAELFLRKESGLFGEALDSRTVVDQMNVKAMGKELNDVIIQALTLGLNLNDIFDFYTELDRLVNLCPHESAVAYPLTGFNSPTIFVCKKHVARCEYLEVSVKAVNLITKLGELQSGEYQRCKLLTPDLMAFYDEFYDDIKASTSNKPVDKRKGAKPGTPGKADPSKPLPKAGDAKPST